MGYTLKGKNLLPRSKFFPFRVDPYWQGRQKYLWQASLPKLSILFEILSLLKAFYTLVWDKFTLLRYLLYSPSACKALSVIWWQPPKLSRLNWGHDLDKAMTASSVIFRHLRRYTDCKWVQVSASCRMPAYKQNKMVWVHQLFITIQSRINIS